MSGYNMGYTPPIFDDGGYKPFRRRHPFVFALILVVLLGSAGFLFVSCVRAMLSEPGLGQIYGGKQVGVVNIEGIILESGEVVDWIGKLEENPNVVGVLVRINSPGGAVAPSEEIYSALNRLAQEKPLVASMGSLAASGGYMVALPARHIVASPSTVTGSIGTRMDLANWEGLMDKIGIKDQSLASGGMKDAGSPYRDMSEKERAYFMGMLTDMHEYFKELVMKHRKLSRDKLDELADGRAYTGRQALALGLVDSLGDRKDALEKLNSFTGNQAAGNTLLEGPPKKFSIIEELFESMFSAWNRVQAKASFQKQLFYF